LPHYAYSLDGETYTKLNNQRALLYSTVGTKRMGNPVIFTKQDGTYGLITTDNNESSYIMIYHSDDLIHFTNENYLKLNQDGIAVTDLDCVYDENTGKYSIYWTGDDGNTYVSKTVNFNAFTDSVITTYTMPCLVK
jgi:sucrose-6-phosphate hydrolase SacC (GH32 family)